MPGTKCLPLNNFSTALLWQPSLKELKALIFMPYTPRISILALCRHGPDTASPSGTQWSNSHSVLVTEVGRAGGDSLTCCPASGWGTVMRAKHLCTRAECQHMRGSLQTEQSHSRDGFQRSSHSHSHCSFELQLHGVCAANPLFIQSKELLQKHQQLLGENASYTPL